MDIIDLQRDHEIDYFHCLESWSSEMKEAGDHKACWYRHNKDKGLRVKLSRSSEGELNGMIQYLPIEHSFVAGRDLYVILCIWVHGYSEGIGNHQGRGIGTALLQEAENDVRALGAKGIVAWGLRFPVWMKASWFRKHGYKTADKTKSSALLWKTYTEDAEAPTWIHQKKAVITYPGKVTVTAFVNGWCPAQNLTYERALRAAAAFGDEVVFDRFDTSDREVFLEWGVSDGVFLDGKPLPLGPPISLDRMMKLIRRKVEKLPVASLAH